MADLATLGIVIDSSQAPKAAGDLDKLTAAGTRAEASVQGVGAAAKGASVQAAEMARQAQGHAKAVMGLGNAANLSRVQMMELGHVATSLSGSLAAGANPARALAMELPRIAQAAALGQGGLLGMGRAVIGLIAPFLTLAAGAGLLAAAFLGVKQTADATDLQPFINSLGLTDKEMKKLTDTTVTWGDVAKATFQVVAEKAGTSADQITGAFGSAFKSVGDFGKFSASIILAAFGAAVKGVADVVLRLPDIIGGAVVAGANLAIAAVEKMVNLAIGGLNKISSTVNGIFGTGLGQIAEVSLGRVGKGFVSLGDTVKGIGADVSGTFHSLFNQTESTFDEISARAIKLREDALRSQAEDIIGDRAAKAAKQHRDRAKAAKEEADALDKLHKILEKLMAQPAQIDKDLLNMKPPSKLEGPNLDEIFGKLPDFSKQITDSLRVMSDQAQTTAQSMAEAFGKPGEVLGGLLTRMADYNLQQEQIRQQVVAGTLSQESAEKQLADIRNRNVIATISGLKSLFKEHSTGYKVMSAIEKAYAVFQAVQSAAAIARDIAHTVSSLANSATRTTANTAEGGSKLFAQLGVYAFPVVAAMVAVIAALGARGGGGGGSSAVPTSADDVQAAQGTGTVLGSAKAQSESIAHSLELTAANTNKMLEYDNQQLRSLRNIETNIGALATQVAKELQVGGAFDLTGKTGTTSSSGFLGLFSSTKTSSLYDQGLQFDPTTLANAIANGVSGATYQIIEKTKTSSGFLGIGGGTSTSYSTTTGALDPDLQRQVGLILGSLRDSVVQAAKVLGFDVQAALNQFQVEIGKISFKDMSADEIQKALEAVFSKVADQMAGFAVSGLAQFQKAGEGLFETLQRLAKDYTTIDVALKSIGKTFGSVGAASIAARENLIALFGSLENFVDQTSFYQQNFLSDSQQLSILKASVQSQLGSLGLSGVTTIAAFNKVVQGLNLTTTAGQEMYASLMQLAPAFYQMIQLQDQAAQQAAALAKQKAQMEITLLQAQGKATEALAKQRALELAALDPSLRALQQQIYTAQDIASAKDKLAQAYQRERDELQATVDKFGQLSKNLRDYRDTLFGGASGGVTYNSALAKLISTGSLAASGDATALGDLPGVGKSFLDIAKDRAGSLQQYQRDVALVARYVDKGITAADGQKSVAERQLTAMTDQVGKLIDLNASVLSVKDAITALTALLAPAPAPPPATGGGGGGTGGGTRPPRTGGKHHEDRMDRIEASLADIAAATIQTAASSNTTAKKLKDWDRGGSLAVATDADTPLSTTVAS